MSLIKKTISILVVGAALTVRADVVKSPLTRALADSLYCPLASCATASSTTTFTNKTISLGANTVTGTLAQFNTALTGADFVSLAGSEVLTNKTFSLTSNTLTGTSLELKTAISDETGSGLLVFATSPVFTTPNIGSATGSISGNAATATALAADPSGCTNQFVTDIAANGTLTCTTDTLAGAQHANQGTTTTVLHGNAAGNPSFATVGISDVSGSTGTGSFVFSATPTFTGAPVLAAPTATTLQTSGNVGFGVAPSGTAGSLLTMTLDGNQNTVLNVTNSDASGTGARASSQYTASTAQVSFQAHGAGRTATRYGITIGNYNELQSNAGSGLLVGTTNSAEMRLGTNATVAMLFDTSQRVSLPQQALTAGTMTGTYEAVAAGVTTCRSWTNAQVAALSGTAGDIAFGTLPAKTVVTNAYIVITGAAAGPTTVTVALGRVSASYIDYIVASDAKAAANTVYGDASAERGTNLTGYDLPSYTGTTVVNAHFISTVANLSTTTGSTGMACVSTERIP